MEENQPQPTAAPTSAPAPEKKKGNKKFIIIGCIVFAVLVLCCCIGFTAMVVTNPEFSEAFQVEYYDSEDLDNDNDFNSLPPSNYDSSSSSYSFSSSSSLAVNPTPPRTSDISYDNFEDYDFDVVFDAGRGKSFAFNMPIGSSSHRIETNTGCASVALRDGIRVYLGMANADSIDCITRGYFDGSQNEAVCEYDQGVQNSEAYKSTIDVQIGSDTYEIRVWEFECNNGENVISQTYTFVQTELENDIGSFTFMVSSEDDRIYAEDFESNQNAIVDLVESVAVF